MTIVFTVYFFLLGLLITSFTNVVGLRVPVGESIIRAPIVRRVDMFLDRSN